MATILHFLSVFTCLLLSSPSYAQVPTPAPITTANTFNITYYGVWASETLSATSTYTDASSTATLNTIVNHTVNTIVTATDSAVTATYTVYQGLPIQAVSQGVEYLIDVTMIGRGGLLCQYPISGTWSLYPRIIFWLTMIFALVGRKHEWLVGGALAAALSFSSLAALQISFQIWSGSALGEMDFLPIIGILVGSCVIAVPLMNWSRTIQRLGLKQDSKSYGSTRTVLVFWSLLVATGFFSAFFAYQRYIRKTPGSIHSWAPFFKVQDGLVYCRPGHGYLDATQGQLFRWENWYMTYEFLKANNCYDICHTSAMSTLFRSQTESHALQAEWVDRWFERKYFDPSDLASFTLGLNYYKNLLFFIPFLLLQGFLQITFFWRTSPQRARYKIYVWWSTISTPQQYVDHKRTLSSQVGFYLALAFFMLSVATVPFAIIAFIMNLVVTETFLSWLPQSESNDHVDQWGLFAVTFLVLIAAFICRLAPGTRAIWQHPRLKAKKRFLQHQIEQGFKHDRASCKALNCFPEFEPVSEQDKKKDEPKWKRFVVLITSTFRSEFADMGAEVNYRIYDVLLLLKYEWYSLKEFCHSPYIKPQRREDCQVERKDKENKYWKKEPALERDRRRQDLEDENDKLEEAIKKAKDELEERCGSNIVFLQQTTVYMKSQHTDRAPLLQSSSPMGKTDHGRSRTSLHSELSSDAETLNEASSICSISPPRQYRIPRKQVLRSRTPSLNSNRYAPEVQQIGPPIYPPATGCVSHPDNWPTQSSNGLSELPAVGSPIFDAPSRPRPSHHQHEYPLASNPTWPP